ncbi:MAG: secondary thiamine-phosphate synthase enzyme YjbQ [Nanoarchaeota archaeon]|nr:secondary thiamine-phosphate synthase enzyme YjbQ [Nanoarchaeota archaeon]
MPTETKTFSVESGHDMDIINITGQVSKAVAESKINSGIATIFVTGSTAGVTTTEFEPNLNEDLKKAIERIVPSNVEYKHSETWGDDNGKSHVRSSLFKPSFTVPFNDKKLLLGAWQQIILLDFDVPARRREIIVQIVGD